MDKRNEDALRFWTQIYDSSLVALLREHNSDTAVMVAEKVADKSLSTWLARYDKLTSGSST